MTDYMYFMRPCCDTILDLVFPRLCQVYDIQRKSKNVIEHKCVIITKILVCNVAHTQSLNSCAKLMLKKTDLP